MATAVTLAVAFFGKSIVQGSLIAASTAATIFTNVRQGQAAEAQQKVIERQEATDARSREIDRRRRLVQSLASRNNRFAAGGVQSFSGSAGNLQTRDIETAALEQLTDTVASENRISAARLNTSSVKRASLVDSTFALVDSAAAIGRVGKAPANPNRPAQ